MTALNTRDPVQGLVDFTHDVKPFHSKVLEVWVEYIHTDHISAAVVDDWSLVVKIALDRQKKYCEFGFDTLPWNDMLLGGTTLEDVVPGTIRFDNNTKSVKKATAVEEYFRYTTGVWRYNNRGKNDNITQPLIERVVGTPYYHLSFNEVMSVCRQYFAELQRSSDYWYEPSNKALYRTDLPALTERQEFVGKAEFPLVGLPGILYVDNETNKNYHWVKRVSDYVEMLDTKWREVPAFIAPVPPQYPLESDLWWNNKLDRLYQYITGDWQEIKNVHVNYSAPSKGPMFPAAWMSNWDTGECLPPFGETVIYTYVQDKVEFESGSEIFLNDQIQAMVFDPTGNDSIWGKDNSEFYKRTEYPIKYRTTVSQEPDGRYKITRSEVSILTEPNNPEILGNARTIYLNGMEFNGLGINRAVRGVRLQDFATWTIDQFSHITDAAERQRIQKLNNATQRTIFDSDTLGFRVEKGFLVPQKITRLFGNALPRLNGEPVVPASYQREDIATTSEFFPFKDGQIVYFTSSDDLPEYNLSFSSHRSPVTLQRYTPYKIVILDGKYFSVALVRERSLYGEDGQRLVNSDFEKEGRGSGNTTIYEVDERMMQGLPFVTFGSGLDIIARSTGNTFQVDGSHYAEAYRMVAENIPMQIWYGANNQNVIDVKVIKTSSIGNGPLPATIEITLQVIGTPPASWQTKVIGGFMSPKTQGRGELFFGIGHPIPFIEQSIRRTDFIQSNVIQDSISSSTEAFASNRYYNILDVLTSVTIDGQLRHAFVVPEDIQMTTGELFRITNSSSEVNDGEWIVAGTKVYTNQWASIDSNKVPVAAAAPSWWNTNKLGPWPTPVKRNDPNQGTDSYEEYSYYKVTLVFVEGTAPSKQVPHGVIVKSQYDFGEAKNDPNIATTTISESLFFGSMRLVTMEDGTKKMVPEIGTPGVSLRFADTVDVLVHERLHPHYDTGIPTIGSYDVHYYDIGEFDHE